MAKTELKQYKGRRIKVRGRFHRHDIWTFPNQARQNRRRTVLQALEFDGQIVSDHVWVFYSEPLEDAQPEKGELVEFTALVREYDKRDYDGQDYYVKDYCLDYPQDVRLPERHCLRIPDEKPEPEPQAQQEEAVITKEPPAERIPISAIKHVRGLIKHFGPDKVMDSVLLVQDVISKVGTVEDVMELIEALRDD